MDLQSFMGNVSFLLLAFPSSIRSLKCLFPLILFFYCLVIFASCFSLNCSFRFLSQQDPLLTWNDCCRLDQPLVGTSLLFTVHRLRNCSLPRHIYIQMVLWYAICLSLNLCNIAWIYVSGLQLCDFDLLAWCVWTVILILSLLSFQYGQQMIFGQPRPVYYVPTFQAVSYLYVFPLLVLPLIVFPPSKSIS